MVIMSNSIRRLGAVILSITVVMMGACTQEDPINIVPVDCSGLGALGPASRAVPVNTLVQLEIEVIQTPNIAIRSVSWRLERPLGSSATLANFDREMSLTNSFTPDLVGDYRVSRSVGFTGGPDNDCGEFEHTATITAVEGPVADASATQTYWDVGATVTLDGSASSANVETWDWNVVSRSNQIAGVAIPPDGSGETFTFVLTEPNIIEYRLVVSAGSVTDGDWVTVRSKEPSISDVTPRSGAVGDRVVIDGANFSPTASNLHNKVTFNGVEASFVSGSSASVNQLEVYVPDFATSGPVVVEVLGTGERAHGPNFEVMTPGAWEPVLGRGQILNAVHVVDSDIATAVGDIIVRTVNGGQDWTTQTASGGVLTLQDVHFVDANTGYAAGIGSATGGLVLRTTNGGQQWDMVNGFNNEASVSGHMGVSVFDANTATVVGNLIGSSAPRIFRTTDGGTSWNDQTADPDVPAGALLLDVHFVNANVGFVVGRDQIDASHSPLILRTTDGGGDWTRANVPSSLTFTSLYAVHFADANSGWAVGRGSRDGVTNAAIILRTVNGGGGWTEQGQGQVGSAVTLLLGVSFPDDMTGWVVSEGLVYSTVDAGATWIQEFDTMRNIIGGEGVGFGGTPRVGYLVASNPGRIWRRR
jgi:photosystem II stability/assembly factor-like uncharacterized protein